MPTQLLRGPFPEAEVVRARKSISMCERPLLCYQGPSDGNI
jgi:hypothetical protein